jgi:hypothetical protein
MPAAVIKMEMSHHTIDHAPYSPAIRILMSTERSHRLGPMLIATGLAILIAAMLWPAVPAVTAIALVALGATVATIARFEGRPAILPAMLAHVAVYGGLYALAVGATLHAAAARTHEAASLLATIDLAMSIWPMAMALWMTADAVRGDRAAE